MRKVITFEAPHAGNDRVNVTPKQMAMFREAGFNHPIIPQRGSFCNVYYGAHYGEPDYTDEQIQRFIAELRELRGR